METRKLKLAKVRKAIAVACRVDADDVPSEIVNEWKYYLAA